MLHNFCYSYGYATQVFCTANSVLVFEYILIIIPWPYKSTLTSVQSNCIKAKLNTPSQYNQLI